jgi:mono/diheme cytochrome c family protein
MGFHHIRHIALALLVALIALSFGVDVNAQEGVDPEILQLGAEIYEGNCAVCHGSGGEGRLGATLSKNWPSIRPDAQIRATIERGVIGSVMPGWSLGNGGPLSDEEIDALVVYILNWETGGLVAVAPLATATARPPITPVPDVTGDPNRGAVLYDQNCALCHGTNGEGRVGATLAKDWPSIRPDLTVKARISNGVPGSVMPAFSQGNGGPMTEGDINDIVAYIMTWPESGATASMLDPTPTATPRTGLTDSVGFIIAIVLFAGILAIIVILQRRK